MTLLVAGGKLYDRCVRCDSLVRVNKPLLGSAHICLTDCEAAKRHLAPREIRRGWPWNRRTVVTCDRCGQESE